MNVQQQCFRKKVLHIEDFWSYILRMLTMRNVTVVIIVDVTIVWSSRWAWMLDLAEMLQCEGTSRVRLQEHHWEPRVLLRHRLKEKVCRQQHKTENTMSVNDESDINPNQPKVMQLTFITVRVSSCDRSVKELLLALLSDARFVKKIKQI